jgi:hypothetical protein
MHIPLVLKLVTAFYEKTYPGILGYFFCRFRYYDELIKECLEKNELDTIVDYLSNFGLTILDHVGPEEFKNRYENLKKIRLDVIEVERLVLAEVK